MAKNYGEEPRGLEQDPELELGQTAGDADVESLNERAEALQREERIQELMRLDPSLLEEVQRRSKEKVTTAKKTEVISEKDAHRNEILRDLGDGMHVGEPRGFNGSRQEVARGVYDGDGKFIGNILVADQFGDVPKNELQDKAWELVAKSLGRDTRPEIKREAPEVNIDGGAKKIMAEMDVSLRGDTLYLFGGGKPEQITLFGEGENQRIDIVKGKNELQLTIRVTEHRGKVIEYNINNGVFDFESRRVKLGGENTEQAEQPEEFNYEERIRAEQERFAKIEEEEKEFLERLAKDFGFSSIDELADKFDQLEKLREEEGVKKFNSGELVSQRDASLYRMLKNLETSHQNALKGHEELLEKIESIKKLYDNLGKKNRK